MKTIVIYRSKSGFVKKYAEWIAHALAADLFEADKVCGKMLTAYDTIIYGGGLYAVGINGVKLIKNNLDKLQGKKVIVFCSGASEASEKVIKDVCDHNFSPKEQQRIRLFYLRGGFDFSKLKPMDKVLMTIMKWMLKAKKERTAEDEGMLALYDHPADYTKEQNIEELIAYAKTL